ncbi:MAG TPA: hypothetical protein VKG23_09045 [Thermoanaerobaculia bacterium]|nr:hypothetical protein [Thermoanaerobaculia bacterium]
MRRRFALGFAAAVLAAAVVGAQAAPPTPRPTLPSPPPPARGAKAGAPLDFSGVWEIDLARSEGVSTSMKRAVLSVRQNGSRIWIEPVEQPRPYLSADEIVVDGKLYEKAIGRGEKGTVQAQWAKDRKSLWIQTVTTNGEGAEVAFQRSQWLLTEGGKVWTRHTWTVQKGQNRESLLVFNKRPGAAPAAP